ncbi:hypothetical protein CALVIDRAFT_559312 [Calocera viscosa TUFC12733]|uniref:Phosphatidylglycerol/phosphatidylinositol transfer protein n=1 Tax=Calocera viscosa (strain TUFC12733) TaxID=1330018 RepID=A0A167S1R1_CALVF|nr:hypothetical protein CALVIDRAFT_559312 [Calocera viscosa TUFC12733]
MFPRTIVVISAFAALALAISLPELNLGGDVIPLADWTWTDCGDESYAIEIQSIEVFPDPPVPGQNLTVTVTGTTRMPIEDGAYADVTVKLGPIQLLKKRFDVCEEATNMDLTVQCPVEPSDYHLSHTVALPRKIPKAKFGIQVSGMTQDDEDMVCLDIVMNFLSERA